MYSTNLEGCACSGAKESVVVAACVADTECLLHELNSVEIVSRDGVVQHGCRW